MPPLALEGWGDWSDAPGPPAGPKRTTKGAAGIVEGICCLGEGRPAGGELGGAAIGAAFREYAPCGPTFVAGAGQLLAPTAERGCRK